MSTEKKYVVRKGKNVLCNEGQVKSYVEGLLGEFIRNPEVKLCLT